MATLLTARDHDILAAIDRGPLTVRQLLKLSTTFSRAFLSARRLQRRLQALVSARLLVQRRYASAGPGAEAYYTLAAEGYRLLYPELTHPKTPGAVGLARQHHTRCLADFVVHTVTAAHVGGFTIAEFQRENTLRLEVNSQCQYPDCAFTLLTPGRPALRFFVELDNGTEPIASPRECDSWERKLRFYEALQDARGYRFRVLSVVTRSADRVRHIVAKAAEIAHNPDRSVVYGVCLRDYLAEADPLQARCFLDHRGDPIPLVPPIPEAVRPVPTEVARALAVVG